MRGERWQGQERRRRREEKTGEMRREETRREKRKGEREKNVVDMISIVHTDSLLLPTSKSVVCASAALPAKC